MNKKKILRCLLGASIIGSVLIISYIKMFAESKCDKNSWKYTDNKKDLSECYNWYYFNNEGIMQTG